MYKSIIKNSFLLMRPYSLTSIAAIAILAYIFIFGKVEFTQGLVEDILIALLVWVSVVFLLENFHKHVDNRKKIPFFILLTCLLLLVVLLAKNLLALLVLPILLICDAVYSLKAKNWPLSPFVFIFRGTAEVGIITIILLMHSQSPLNPLYWPLIIPIFLITISRNLVGDIRDMDRDKFTLPKKFGTTAAYALSALFLIAAIAYIGNALIFFPLLPVLIMLLLRWKGHFVHSFYIISTLFFLINYISFRLGYDLLTNLLLFVGFVLFFTYDLVPRRAEKDLNSV